MAQMVTIACKAPNGLKLNLDRYEVQGTQGAVRRIPGPQTVVLKGWARPWGMPDTTEGGYALTQVPADFWEAWIATHADNVLVTSKTILGPHKDALGQAHGHASVEQMFRPARVEDVGKIAADKAD